MRIKLIISLIIFTITSTAQNKNDPVNFVNPFIGTANGGNTFPGAVVPWGMVSVSPHNAPGSPSGYLYGEKYFYGFGHTHLSGTGCSDLGAVIITATRGDFNPDPENYKTTYSSESASPGYYSVKLIEPGIIAEATATSRCGLTKFSSEDEGKFNILLDLGRSLNLLGGGNVKIVADDEVEGWNISGGFCGEANRQTTYFVARFNYNSTKQGVWLDDKLIDDRFAETMDRSIGVGFSFEIDKEIFLLVKVGISYTSIENARENMEEEIPGWNFDLIKMKAEHLWNENLSRINLEDKDESNKIKFYSALYHMLIHPNIINDVNGEYPLMGRTGTGKYNDRNRYTIFSLWDTYRTLHPFLTLVYPEVQSEIIKTMIDMYKESGYLPKWELTGAETYMMVGDASAPVIADSYIKGINDFDAEKAFEALLKPTQFNAGESAPPIRAGYHELLQYGYIPFEQDWNDDWWVWGPVSTTLEYCLSDWSIGQIAKKMGEEDIYSEYNKRSMNYKNLFDNSTLFMRPKLKNGNWVTPFDSLATEGSGDWLGSGGPGYVEGNAWNYTWFVPHDIEGLINLFGGVEPFAQKLIRSFNNGQFTITNEPDIAYPYLFNYADGYEYLTPKLVKNIMDEDFGTGPDGLPGNDDCGTISGWFVFSALGFYPACAADESYQIGTPLFDEAVIHLNENYHFGNEFVIEKIKKDYSTLDKIVINNNEIKNRKIYHQDIIEGGKLIFYQ